MLITPLKDKRAVEFDEDLNECVYQGNTNGRMFFDEDIKSTIIWLKDYISACKEIGSNNLVDIDFVIE